MVEADREVLRNPQTEYERRDLPLLAYAFAAIGLTLLLGAAPVVIRAVYMVTRHDVDRRITWAPPTPRLQTDPPADLAIYLAQQRTRLNSYGWIDRDKGIARQPIGAAMKRLLESGADGFPPPGEER